MLNKLYNWIGALLLRGVDFSPRLRYAWNMDDYYLLRRFFAGRLVNGENVVRVAYLVELQYTDSGGPKLETIPVSDQQIFLGHYV